MLEQLAIHRQRMNFNLHLTPYIEINSKWVTELNVQCENLKNTFRKQYRQNPSGSEDRSVVFKIDPKPTICKNSL